MKWIFSYGSLIWRPAIPYIKRRKASLFGWRRRFWQLSSDHRGTFASPGRVVTLVRDDSSQCVGVAFGIADEDWEEVKTNLDYREKNGYKRHLVQIAFENIDSSLYQISLFGLLHHYREARCFSPIIRHCQLH